MKKVSKRFPLILASPTPAGRTRLLTVQQSSEYRMPFWGRFSFPFQHFGGEVWRSAGQELVIFQTFYDTCSCLMTAASISSSSSLRLTYPPDQNFDLPALYDFMALGSSMEVILEVADDIRDQVQTVLEDLENEYEPPASQPDVSYAVQSATALLRDDIGVVPKHLRSCLHTLRHLDRVEVCLAVMQAHQEFYSSGIYETDKHYFTEERAKNVANNLARLYQWADTPAWQEARKQFADIPFPTPWRPGKLRLARRFSFRRPVSVFCRLKTVLGKEEDDWSLERERLEKAKAGDQQCFKSLISNAAWGNPAALKAVSADPDLFGVKGVRNLLMACQSSEEKSRELAKGWVRQFGYAELKLQAYFLLREDQAREVPILDTTKADHGSAGLYKLLTDQSVVDYCAQKAKERFLEHRCYVLDRRIDLRISAMNDDWARVFAPLLCTRRAVARAKGLSWSYEEARKHKLAFATDIKGASTRFYLDNLIGEKLAGRLVCFNRDLVVCQDNSETRVTLWRFEQNEPEIFQGGYWWNGSAYAPESGLLAALESTPRSDTEYRLLCQYLPMDSNTSPGLRMFPGGCEWIGFSPGERFLGARGRQGYFVYRVGDWDKPLHSGRGATRFLDFSPDEQWLALGVANGVRLVSCEDFQTVAEYPGFQPRDFRWKDGHLIALGEDSIVSLRLPDLELVSRLAVQPKTANLQQSWCMVSGFDEQRRYSLPNLKLIDVIRVKGSRSLLTPDEAVLVVIEENVLYTYCKESLQRMGRFDRFFLDNEATLRLTDDGRNLLLLGSMYTLAFPLCAGHMLTAETASNRVPRVRVEATRPWSEFE